MIRIATAGPGATLGMTANFKRKVLTVSDVNVLTITFKRDEQAFPAMTELSELDRQGQVTLRAAAVVSRDAAGKVQIKGKVGGSEYLGTGTGGILGLLIGVIGGPLGLLVGGVAGLGLGYAIDLEHDEESASVLGAISQRLRVGSDALLAEVQERSPDVVDSAMEQRSGTVVRQDLADVEAEIAVADEIQRQARQRADAQLRDKRREAHHEKVEARIAELKATLQEPLDDESEEHAPKDAQRQQAHVGSK